MNLLGHAYLSFGDPEILCGNMMGDHVKGKKILDTFPDKIKQGLILHRKIDEFTDFYPAVFTAKNYFREDFRLYSGAILDIVWDHFLANDPKYFASKQALIEFSNKALQDLETTETYQPESFIRLRGYMKKDQILVQYRNLKGLRIAFEHLCARMKYINADPQKALEITTWHYYELNQLFYDLMDHITIFVKNELNMVVKDKK